MASIAEELMQRGRQEGAIEALRSTLRALVEQRFGPVPESLAERIASASQQDLELAVSHVLVVADPGSLFQPH